MSASTVELGFLDDFLGLKVLVFVNGFWARSSLCTLKISASAVELHFEDNVWDTRDSVFLQRFVCQEYFMCAEDLSVTRRTALVGWFFGPRVLVFDNGL
jgi:hypothetical protein